MAQCPKCRQVLLEGAVECAFCGIVLSKWRPAPAAGSEEAPPPVPPPPGETEDEAVPPEAHFPGVPPAPPRSTKWLPWVVGLCAAALLLAVAGCGGLWWLFKARPWERWAQKAMEEYGQELLGQTADKGPFDLKIPLDGDPLSLTYRPGELVAGNRRDPWGFLRLKVTGPDTLSISQAPITEKVYGQKIGNPWGIAWNGEHFVAYFDGAWVQKPGHVFTFHDPVSLEILSSVPAPEHLGALVWDGLGYWAATRKNTLDAPEEAFLYRLDASLNVTATYPPPAVGCQGLAWDGEHLWWADVFEDALFVLDVSGPEPLVVVKKELPFTYPSGVAFDGERIWVCEYGDMTVRRLALPLQRALKRGLTEPEPEVPFEVLPAPPREAGAQADVAALRAQLRSEDASERLSAEFALKRLGLQPDYGRYDNGFPPSGDAGAAEVLKLEAEVRDGAVYAAWTTYFGEDLFRGQRPSGGAESGGFSMPTFAKYTVRVEGEALTQKFEREFEASPGTVEQPWTELVGGLGSGTCEVSLFIHVQYVDREGTNRILNSGSIPVTVGLP